MNKKTVNCRLVGENTKIMFVMRRASTWSGKKYIAVTSNTKLTFHGVIVKCSDCQKTIFDLIERSHKTSLCPWLFCSIVLDWWKGPRLFFCSSVTLVFL